MTNEEHEKALHTLRDKLIENYAVYHERVTLLIQLTLFEIEETRVNFRARIIKPLDKLQAERKSLYHKMVAKNEFSLGATYLFGQDENNSILENNKLGRAYCPFTLWLDPELSKFVNENEDAITKQVPKYILWNQDWREIK